MKSIRDLFVGYASREFGNHSRAATTVPRPAMKPTNMSQRRRLVPGEARDGDEVEFDDDHISVAGRSVWPEDSECRRRLGNRSRPLFQSLRRHSRMGGVTGQPVPDR